MKDEELSAWPEITKCQLETGRDTLVSCKEVLRVMEVFGVAPLQALTTQAMEVDGNGIVFTLEVKSSSKFARVRNFFHPGTIR